MLKNYLKITFRNFSKNKVYVFINIIGMGLALACCIVAYLNTQFDWDFDKNHVNIDKIYKIHSNKDIKGQLVEYGITPRPLGPAIATDISGIDHVVRYSPANQSVEYKELNKILSQSIGFVDPGFLDVFTFPEVKGSAKSYEDIQNVVITERTAAVYFGDEEPLGKVLTVYGDDGDPFNFIVSAIIETPPLNTSIQFDLLLAYENFYKVFNLEKNDWKRFAGGTFLYSESGIDVAEIEKILTEKFVRVQNAAREDWKIARYNLVPMAIHGHISNDIRADWLWDSMHPAAVIAPPIMAILILLIACFNFTNTAIATSNNRLKEIGLRKVMGGNRNQLIVQFMTENLIICLIAIIFSMAVAIWMVPAYSAMWQGMTLEMNFTENIGMYLFLFSLLIFTAILAGGYPSIYVSRYEPVKILRGTLEIGGASRLSKILLGLQFTITVMALFASIAFIQNATYQNELDMGFDRDQIIGVPLENNTEYQKMLASFQSNPAFKSIAGTGQHIGSWNYSRTLKSQDTELEVGMMNFGPNYVETLGLTILEGRSFKKELEKSDIKNSILVNERLVEEFGWKDPIGQRLSISDSVHLSVVGVMKNFYMAGFWEEIDPMAMRLDSTENFNYIVGKVDVANITDAYNYLENEWLAKIESKTFNGFYQEDLVKEAKEVNNNILILFSFLGIIAVVLSGVGLFTMVSLSVIKKVKEIGVRKVLGGSVGHIVALINRQFLVMLTVSSILGVIGGYFLIDALIASIFVYYKNMDLYTFLIPSATILIISLIISSIRIYRTAIQNPIDSLRYE